MKEKINQFVSNLIGQFVEVSDKSNIYQCMDLAYLWAFVLDIPKVAIQHLYASEIFTKPNGLTREYFDIIPNTSNFVPEDGDIAVFSNKVLVDGVWIDIGHVGVCLGGGNKSTFKDFEQNWPLGTNANIHDRNYDTPKLLGVLRPKGFYNDDIERLPKDSILRDIRTALCGGFSDDEIKADLASNKNILEITESICQGDEKFYNKWIKSHVKDADSDGVETVNNPTSDVKAPQNGPSEVAGSENAGENQETTSNSQFVEWLKEFFSKLGLWKK